MSAEKVIILEKDENGVFQPTGRVQMIKPKREKKQKKEKPIQMKTPKNKPYREQSRPIKQPNPVQDMVDGFMVGIGIINKFKRIAGGR